MDQTIKQAQTVAHYIALQLDDLAEGRLRQTETELHLSHGFISRA